MTKLLIVDDDVNFCLQLKSALEQKDFRCYVLHDAENVVEIIQHEEIPVVLLDVMLPKVSGFEACRKIRINRYTYNTGIIFLTVMGEKEEMDHGLAQGGDDYLVKPISLPILISRVHGLLDTLSRNPLFDRTTGLGSIRYIRLEIQRNIFLQRNFGLIYGELTEFNNIQSIWDVNTISKIIRTFAYQFKLVGKKYYGEEIQLGYLGNGHFIACVSWGDLDGFLHEMKENWEKSIFENKSILDFDMGRFPQKFDMPLCVSFCAMKCNPTPSTSVNDVLETLQKLYLQCKNKSQNGILIDRRTKR